MIKPIGSRDSFPKGKLVFAMLSILLIANSGVGVSILTGIQNLNLEAVWWALGIYA
tara:strand:+ start:64 stop:231 length:168 start_codon:yes stop_codon:yes gene_type:complete